MNIVLFLAGLAALVIGSDLLVRGASRFAIAVGISPLVVGLTVVAFGTSAPEMAVSASAVLQGQNNIAIGNVVGSNIFNVLFILGLSAVITPMIVNVQIVRQEVPIMLGASLLLLVLGLDGRIDAPEGVLLFGLLLGYTVFLVKVSRSETQAAHAEYSEGVPAATAGGWDSRLPVQLALIAAGLVLLVLGSQWLVSASVAFARALGVSDLVIGLTIIAAGTSMPEVATSITAALRGERDIAVGNVVGSNTFNILGCVGVSGMLAGSDGLVMSAAVVNFDIWVMLAVALACLPVFVAGHTIARWEGAVFLAYYVAYVAFLVMDATGHDALPAYSRAMTGVVVPATIITLVISMIRPPAAAGR